MIYLNDTSAIPTVFPDGTSQVWKLPDAILLDSLNFFIRWEFESEAEFLHLAQLKTLLDTQYGVPVFLEMPYLPYARQDKRPGNSRTFALHTFAKLLNSLAFTKVVFLDAHSAVATKLIENSVSYMPTYMPTYWYVRDVLRPTCVFFPDIGARTRYTAETFSMRNVGHADKIRDQATGQILSYEVAYNSKDFVPGADILIIDDICDGGATFVLLANALYAAGAKNVMLFVTHGIFSKGLQPLTEAGISRIFTHKGEVTEIQGRIAYKTVTKETT